MKTTWLDRTITWLSPARGAKRMASRVMAAQVENVVRGFDAASNGRRTKNWKAGAGSANAENRPALATLRNRARDLVRNEAYAKGAVDSVVSNTIGAGILAHAIAKTAGRKDKFEMLWLDWAESTQCDVDGMNNFYGLQALIMRHLFTDGEVLVRKVPRSSAMKLAVPMQLQVLEADFLDASKEMTTTPNGEFVVQGVQFNKQGKRVGYWVFENHPGDSGTVTMRGMNSKFVPADEMLHIFRVDRAGQVRGITWFAPIMIRMKDYSDFSDATLLRQKLAACFTAFVTTPEGTTGLDDTETPALGEKLEPGIIEVLKQGQSVEFANPPTSGDFSTFTREQIRAMAKGIGVSYEVLSNDYSQVNFSSGRMGWIEFQRNIDQWRWHLIIPHFCIPAWKWFVDAAALMGMGSDPVGSRWTPPKRDMIDPDKEIGASLKQVRAGMKSLSAAIREQGEEPMEVLEQIAEDNKAIDSLGLILDSDPRKTNEFGAPYESAPAEQPATEEQTKSEPAPIVERYLQDNEGSIFKLVGDQIEKIS